MVVGGVLWILYGPLTMLHPWGADVTYLESRGYSVIVDPVVFLAYSLPGSLALILTAGGLLGMIRHLSPTCPGRSRVLRGLVYLAVGLGILSLVGAVVLFDPVFTAARIFGTLALGAALALSGWAARNGRLGRAWAGMLLGIGVIGVLLLPVWPLVFALGWFTEEAGALSIALFGIGWLVLGGRCWHLVHRGNRIP